MPKGTAIITLISIHANKSRHAAVVLHSVPERQDQQWFRLSLLRIYFDAESYRFVDELNFQQDLNVIDSNQ